MIEKKSVFGYGYGSKKTAFNGIINYIAAPADVTIENILIDIEGEGDLKLK